MNIIGGVLQENPFFPASDQRLSEAQRREGAGTASPSLKGAEVEPEGESEVSWSVRELIGMLSLPAVFAGSDSDQIVQTVLEILTAKLRLDFAFLSLQAASAENKRYFLKVRGADQPIAPDQMARLLENQLSPHRRSTTIQNPLGDGSVRLVWAPLGVHAEWGTVIVGSQKHDFPQQRELLLLTVTCDQVALALEHKQRHLLAAEKSRLDAEQLRTAAELTELRAHLDPHFLLNTLNAIAGLVKADPPEARRLLVYMGDLLRDSLADGKDLQTVQEQMDWLRCYADIFETRYAGRLSFRWEIFDQSRAFLLPRLLLQPLVENAVRHGALMRPNGVVIVRSELANSNGAAASKLVCIVEDNGPGLPEGGVPQAGAGLLAVQRRLALNYGDRASLKLESSSSGTRSIVELPPQRTDEVRRPP